VLVAAADRGAVPERWGLGVGLRILGRSLVTALLVVADELEAHDPAGLDHLRIWGASRRLRTPAGAKPVEVVTRSEFFDPDDGVFTTTAYTGGGWLITGDEGRTLGLSADHWGPAQGQRFTDGFTLGFPGWGEIGEWVDQQGRTHRGWRANLHRPTARVKAIGSHGLLAEFNKAGRGGRTLDREPAGHWGRDHLGRFLPFRGRFADLVGPAFALDGIDTGDLSEHLDAFGLEPLDVPAAVIVDEWGADHLLGVALAVHRLAVALDAEAALWLTTAAEQRDGRAVVGIGHLVSPGSLATASLRRSGLTPPLRKFATPDDETLDLWAAAGHGGWVT
jgi:hypothetical protein